MCAWACAAEVCMGMRLLIRGWAVRPADVRPGMRLLMCGCAMRRAVAFRIYDLNDSGVIEKEEVQRLLVALLQDNPAIDLSNAEIQQIVEQARPWGMPPPACAG